MVIRSIVKLLMKRTMKEQRHPSRVVGHHVQSIAVVACSSPEADFQTALKLRKDLFERGLRKVDLFVSYPTKKAVQNAEQEEGLGFSPKSFNWIGRIQSPELSKALKNDYEVLIDLTEGRSFIADVLISKLKAKWKAGRRIRSREYLLDLMIDLEDDRLSSLIQHIDHYLQTLNKSTAA